MKQPISKDHSFSLGVDVVEFQKAKAFYGAHQDKLSRFLTNAEKGYVKNSRTPHVALAMLVGAKEAAFKALRPVWLGLTPFKDIEIVPAKNEQQFSLKLKGQTKKMLRSKTHLEFFFFKQKDFVVVECAGIL